MAVTRFCELHGQYEIPTFDSYWGCPSCFREGAEAMREAAAKACALEARYTFIGTPIEQSTAEMCAKLIRALPLPEPPK